MVEPAGGLITQGWIYYKYDGKSVMFLDQVKRVFPFHLISDEVLSKYLSEFDLLEFTDGTTIFSEGEMADALFFILSGSIKLQPKASRNRTCQYSIY